MSAERSDFLNVFQEFRDGWQQLLELSRQQMALIQDDDYVRLLELFGRKQQVLSRLDELNRRHPRLRERWHEHRSLVDSRLRNACEHLLAEAEALLADLLEHERRSTDELVSRRDRTQRQLQEIASGAGVHAAYRDGLAAVTHRHLDVNQ